MLIENVSRIEINNNLMLIPRRDYFVLYQYTYNPYTKEFVWVEIDEVQTIKDGFKYNKKFHHAQFTKKDFERGIKD